MQHLQTFINQAKKGKYALGHFNISTIDALWGIVDAALDLDVPVIIGVSEGERDFLGISQTAALVHSLRHQLNHPIFLNADHTYSLDRIKQVVAAGYDSVIFDGAKLDFQQNLTQTRQVVQYVKSQAPHILVEAEVGYIGASSKLLDELPKDAIVADQAMPSVEDIIKFVTETQVDLISPAVGNVHGMLKNSSNPTLNTQHINRIAAAVSTPLVLHGGSGVTDHNLIAAIKAGMSLVHVNTEIRVAWKNALTRNLQDNLDEVAPYKILEPSKQAVKKVVTQKLKLFHNP